MIAGLALGAPGIYELPPESVRALTGVRMDVAAFVGVSPRGSVRRPVFLAPWAPPPVREETLVDQSVPVAVESWSEYVRYYGAFEGPGLLPYAVSSFFENGGQRAYIVRIVHRYTAPNGSPDDAANAAGVAAGVFSNIRVADLPPRPLRVRARDEGAWGNALSARLTFTARRVTAAVAGSDVTLPLDTSIVAGALLRLGLAAVPNGRAMRFVAAIRESWDPITGQRALHGILDGPVFGAVSTVELVTGTLTVDDGDGRRETIDDLGFSSIHPRWLARALVEESALLYPADDFRVPPGDPTRSWIDDDLLIDPSLPTCIAEDFNGGSDRYADITPADFFDDEWVIGDEWPGAGVHSLGMLDDLSIVVAPDLYEPGVLPPLELVVDDISRSGDFELCPRRQPAHQDVAPGQLDGLLLDPILDFETIVSWQRRLVDLADTLASFIVLLDVPPRIGQRRILDWRSRFNSAFAAAYHPWLEVARADLRNSIVRVNPSAVAAGIIAQQELAGGVQQGPANLIAASVVNVDDLVSPARHDELHRNAINVYLVERDGARLTAARTLSLDRRWRQLNVRRLVTMLERALYREMQWCVFEPNGSRLRADVTHLISAFLRELYRANAFAGATEQEAFFVRCDDALNPPAVMDLGQLVTHIGVAPAEPLEFIVLRLTRDGDATVRIQEQ